VQLKHIKIKLPSTSSSGISQLWELIEQKNAKILKNTKNAKMEFGH